MSVNWKWGDKMGTVECKQGDNEYTLNVYKANCLCVLVYEYEKDGKHYYDYGGHFNDLQHLKVCVGLSKDWKGEKENIYKNLWVKWKLNTYYKETFSIVKPLTQAGFTVELFYKEAN